MMKLLYFSPMLIGAILSLIYFEILCSSLQNKFYEKEITIEELKEDGQFYANVITAFICVWLTITFVIGIICVLA